MQDDQAASSSILDGQNDQPMSKSRQKRLAKVAMAQQRRAEKKAKAKADLADLRAKRAAGELPPDVTIPTRKRRKLAPSEPVQQFAATIVVDLGFDNLMNDREIVSLTQQLAHVYSSSRKSTHTFTKLLFTSLNGKTLARLDSLADAAYRRWRDVEWWTTGYEQLWAMNEPLDHKTDGEASEILRCERNRVVYLTADAQEELSELSEGDTYVIGGIVDRNRYKNLCLSKAEQHGVRTARLPIGSHVANMTTRKVLTVNQAYDILLKWLEHRDWEKALYAVIPPRKFKASPSGPSMHDEPEETFESEHEDVEAEQGLPTVAPVPHLQDAVL